MSEKTKGILFDMDGVLVNTEPLHFRMWKEVMGRRNISLTYEVYKGCIGSTIAYLFSLVEAAYSVDLGKDPDILAEADRLKREIVEKEGYPRVAHVPETVRRLYEAGYVLAVASSSPPRYIGTAMEELGIRSCFSLLNSAEWVARPKPAPDIYLDTMEKLGLSPEECVVIEDSENGSKAAEAAGIPCVGFCNPDSGNQDLSRTVRLIHDMTEFTPEFIRRL